MFSVCFCTFAFVMYSSYAGMPVSGTHAVIGSLLGGGIIIKGFSSLNWAKMGWIVLSWFISPTFAALIAYLLMIYVATFTMQTKAFYFRSRIMFLQIVGGFCFLMMFYLGDKILNKHEKIVDEETYKVIDVIPPNRWGMSEAGYFATYLPLGFFVGVLVARIIMALHIIWLANTEVGKFTLILNSIFMPWSTYMFEEYVQTFNTNED